MQISSFLAACPKPRDLEVVLSELKEVARALHSELTHLPADPKNCDTFVFVFVFVFVCVLAEPRECSFTERKDCPTRARWRNSGARGKWGSCVRANLATSLCLNSHFYQKAGTTLVKRSTVTQLGTGVASHDRLLTQHSSAARTLPKKNTKHKCATSAPTYPGAALTSRR